jgi:hypothetical protein
MKSTADLPQLTGTGNTRLPIQLVIQEEDSSAQSDEAVPSSTDPSLERWLDDTGCEIGFCYEDSQGYRLRLHGAGSFVFPRGSNMVRGTPNPGVAPGSFRRAFYRHVLPQILPYQSWEVLHASGLVVAGAGVALCGSPTMGKSTLAHAWQQRGGDVFADDAVPFRVEDSAVRVCPIPFRIRPRPPSDIPSEAGLAQVRRLKVQRLTALDPGLTLAAIYLLDRRLDDADDLLHLRPVAAPEALPPLLNQAFCLHLRDRARNRAMVEQYTDLVLRVPVFRLSYPTDPNHVGTILNRLEAHVRSLERRVVQEAER